jgi:hypothetical protein
MIKRALTPVSAMHITASVFINDDESGLHHDYEVWLERLAPHAPIDQYWHNRTGEDNADAYLKRNATRRVEHIGPTRETVVVAVTNGPAAFTVTIQFALSPGFSCCINAHGDGRTLRMKQRKGSGDRPAAGWPASAEPLPLIRTKLQRPRLRENLVARLRQLAQLHRDLKRRLMLASALAGAGKSTLLCQWLVGRSTRTRAS